MKVVMIYGSYHPNELDFFFYCFCNFPTFEHFRIILNLILIYEFIFNFPFFFSFRILNSEFEMAIVQWKKHYFYALWMGSEKHPNMIRIFEHIRVGKHEKSQA